MNPPPLTPEALTPEALLEHSVGLRRLARSLVADAAAADDLLQDTLARALEGVRSRTPVAPSNPRAWLARVMRNAAHEERRRGSRREGRERDVAREEARSSAGELVERFDSRMLVARAVRELDEPYRAAILLRYFEGLPPRRIAARLGVPVKTVDSRIYRGLERLRLKLDDEHDGDRAAWCALILPLAREPLWASFSTGVLLMNAKILGSLLVVVLGAILFFVLREDAVAGKAVQADALEAEQDAGSLPSSSETSPATSAGAREVAETIAEVASELDTDEPAVPEVEGHAYLLSGSPAAGVRLVRRTPGQDGDSTELTTDAQGRFFLPHEAEFGTVSCIDERYVGVLDYEYKGYREDELEPIVVVAPIMRVAGHVLTGTGAAIHGADLELELPDGFRAQLPFDLSSTRPTSWGIPSDPSGLFLFTAAPNVEGLVCVARMAGYEEARVVVEESAATTLELVLERPGIMTRLDGVVLGEAGEPIPGARVALGMLPATADEEGQFALEFDASAPPERLMAVAPGKLPEVVERGVGAWPPFVEVSLAREPLSIRGVVLGTDGKPPSEAWVWIDEPTVFASWEGGFWVAENFISGSRELQLRVRADAEGRFELKGLTEREYGLHAMDGARAWQIEAGRFEAGSDGVEIRFPGSGMHARLEGRVVDRLGQAVPDVQVIVATTMLAARDPSGMEYYNGWTGSSAVSDEQGVFVLEDVPIEGATLDLGGADLILGQGHPIPASAQEPLVIVVARRCELRVDRPAGAQEAASFSLLGAAGETLAMVRREVGEIHHLERAPLIDGQSEVLRAPDTAVVLVLLDAEDQELRRMDVRLRPGETNVIR